VLTCQVVENVPLLKEALVLRDEAARLLGYNNHAEYVIKDKMAKTPDTVFEFLYDLQAKLKPIAEKQAAKLLELKEADHKDRGLEFDGRLYNWDYPFYDTKLLEEEYQVDELKISEYFPVDSTLDKMLGIFSDLFGFVFVRLDDAEKARLSPTGKAADVTWHPDVVMFAVWDNERADADDDGFRGYLYMDLHPRDGKYTHAADWGLVSPSQQEKPLTGRNRVTNALVCNLSKPTATKPALLMHDEVETVFHELGHGIHHLASRPHYSYFTGHAVSRDFVEAPSQMLENWVWTPSVLKNISRHYQTGAAMPDDLIENLIRTRRVDGAITMQRQLHYGLFDMLAHTPKSHQEIVDMDVSAMYNKLRPQVQPVLSTIRDYDPVKYNNE
jgi:metallopeptidase MepB